MTKRRWRRVDAETRREVIRLAARGATLREIVSALDVSFGSVAGVLRPLGGVVRKESWACGRLRLCLDERVEIFVGVQQGLTFTAIAAQVGRAVSTVPER